MNLLAWFRGDEHRRQARQKAEGDTAIVAQVIDQAKDAQREVSRVAQVRVEDSEDSLARDLLHINGLLRQ